MSWFDSSYVIHYLSTNPMFFDHVHLEKLSEMCDFIETNQVLESIWFSLEAKS